MDCLSFHHDLLRATENTNAEHPQQVQDPPWPKASIQGKTSAMQQQPADKVHVQLSWWMHCCALATSQGQLPARAATEGIAGANNASAKTKLYVSPRVVFPNRATIP